MVAAASDTETELLQAQIKDAVNEPCYLSSTQRAGRAVLDPGPTTRLPGRRVEDHSPARTRVEI